MINDIFGKSISIYGSSVVQKKHICLMQIRTQKEGNINEMSLSMEEEALSNYKGLYDKSHKDFHRKDIKKNT